MKKEVFQVWYNKTIEKQMKKDRKDEFQMWYNKTNEIK